MRKGRDKDGDGPGPSGEDIRLWKAFTRDIEPLEGRYPGDDEEEAFPPDMATDRNTPAAPMGDKKTAAPTVKPKSPVAHPPQLDGKTDDRLRRGRIPIEGKLDLHGYNQGAAHGMLLRFVMDAYARGKRCVLVITGKGGGRIGGLFGERPEGILRQKLPGWLSEPPLRDIVLKAVHAAPKDGGSGAFYLYLKRSR